MPLPPSCSLLPVLTLLMAQLKAEAGGKNPFIGQYGMDGVNALKGLLVTLVRANTYTHTPPSNPITNQTSRVRRPVPRASTQYMASQCGC